MASASIEGIGELDALAGQLHRKAASIGRRADEVLRASAGRVEAGGRTFAPVLTGFLRSSISTDVSGSAAGAGIEAEIGPTAFYGGFQEHGTSVLRPRPYMGPSLDREGPRFEEAAERIADPFD